MDIFEIDLVKEEILEIKDDIEKLIYSKTRRMDFNIGVVLHFISKKAREFGKVGYLGSGADEIFSDTINILIRKIIVKKI